MKYESLGSISMFSNKAFITTSKTYFNESKETVFVVVDPGNQAEDDIFSVDIR